MEIKTLFEEKLPQALSRSPEQARELNAVFQFDITGEDGGTWSIDLKSDPPSVAKGAAVSADCVIELASEDFKEMMKDFQVGIQLYFQGKLKITGDPMLATKLQNIFGLVEG